MSEYVWPPPSGTSFYFYFWSFFGILESIRARGSTSSKNGGVILAETTLMEQVFELHQALLAGDFTSFKASFDPTGVYEHVELLQGVSWWSNRVAAAFADDLARRWLEGTHLRHMVCWTAHVDFGQLEAVRNAVRCVRANLQYACVVQESGLKVIREVHSYVWTNEGHGVLRLNMSHGV